MTLLNKLWNWSGRYPFRFLSVFTFVGPIFLIPYWIAENHAERLLSSSVAFKVAILVPCLPILLVGFFAFRSLMNLRYDDDLKFLNSFFVRMPVLAIALFFASNIGLNFFFFETIDQFVEYRAFFTWFGACFLFVWLLATIVPLANYLSGVASKS